MTREIASRTFFCFQKYLHKGDEPTSTVKFGQYVSRARSPPPEDHRLHTFPSLSLPFFFNWTPCSSDQLLDSDFFFFRWSQPIKNYLTKTPIYWTGPAYLRWQLIYDGKNLWRAEHKLVPFDSDKTDCRTSLAFFFLLDWMYSITNQFDDSSQTPLSKKNWMEC